MMNYLQVVQRLLLFVCCHSVIPVFAQQDTDQPMAMARATSFTLTQDATNEKPLKEALEEMEVRYNINISYDPTLIKGKKVQAKIDFGNPIEKNLESLLEKQGLRFKRLEQGYYVVLAKKSKKSALQEAGPGKDTSPTSGLTSLDRSGTQLQERPILQDRVIRGVVNDEFGNPLPGVNIFVKSTTIGTVSDINGSFTLSIPDGSETLVFSFIGYMTEEVAIGAQSEINLQLTPDIATLQEIVVVGYGEQKKANVTGAVSTISTELLEERPASNATNLLAGLAPGLSATQTSGGIAGGDDPVIRLRGVGTLNNSDPLILVDGTPSSMTDINPSDIENISILKDASAAAIYGSRAANGVILITTKRAEEGLKLEYQGFVGFQEVGSSPDLITDPILWMELKNEGLTNGGDAPLFGQDVIDDYRANLGTDPLRYPATDWFDELVGDEAFMTSHTFTLNGGSEASRIRTSLNYLRQDGIGLNNQMDRYSIRINQENKLAENFTFGLNLFGAWSDITPIVDGPASFNNAQRQFLHMGMQEMPIVPTIQAPDGRWGDAQVEGAGSINNWFALASVVQDEQIRQRIQGQLYAGWEILPGLRFDARVALNYDNAQRDQFIGLIPTGSLWNFNTGIGAPNDRGETAFSNTNTSTLLTNFETLTYTKSINGVHNFSVMVGHQLDQFRREEVEATIQEFPSNSTPSLSAGQENPGVDQEIVEWALMSYFGRFSYNFRERYLLEANVRVDGSSRFSDGNKWGTFPSFSAGWRVSEEAFMEDLTIIDELKFRGSWGELGNQQINAYPYQATYSVNESYSFGGNVVTGIAQNDLANNDIQWETTTTWNLGLDLTLLQGKINFSADYFNRETDGILVRPIIPQYLGGKDAPFENLAVVVNDGFEFDIFHRNEIGDFRYSAGLNFTVQDNELTQYLSDVPFIEADATGSYVLQAGQPIWAIYGYQNIGIFQTEDEIANAPTYPVTPSPGDLMFADINGRDEDGNLTGEPDGQINDDDRTIIGNQVPRHLFGANMSFGYKGFDLSVILQGVFDVDTWTGVSSAFWPNDKDDRGQIHSLWTDRWTPDNPSTELPRIVSAGAYGQNVLPSSFFVEDNSFLRVRNITLGYNFSGALLENIKVDKMRVYISADNLLTFSEFQDKWGWDPEREPRQFDVRIPNVRTVVFGANITF